MSNQIVIQQPQSAQNYKNALMKNNNTSKTPPPGLSKQNKRQIRRKNNKKVTEKAMSDELDVRLPMFDIDVGNQMDRIYFIAKTQSGSRFVQDKMADDHYFGLFFKELQSHIAELIIHSFGHYAIEALFEHCDDMQRVVLVSNLSQHMSQIACHKQGSFSIQTIMDTLSTGEQIKHLIGGLKPDIKKTMLDYSGHFVILRFVQRYDYQSSKFIHQAIIENVCDLATDNYGLKVIKATIDAAPIKEMNAVFTAIVKQTSVLADDQYGNYIIQHLLDIAPKKVTDQIKQKMKGKYVQLCRQKFASNVVEKCLRHSAEEFAKHAMAKTNLNKDWTVIIVRMMLAKAGDLIFDKFGNYCLQTALQVSIGHGNLLNEFAAKIKPHLMKLRMNPREKWTKLLEQALNPTSSSLVNGQKRIVRNRNRRRQKNQRQSVTQKPRLNRRDPYDYEQKRKNHRQFTRNLNQQKAYQFNAPRIQNYQNYDQENVQSVNPNYQFQNVQAAKQPRGYQQQKPTVQNPQRHDQDLIQSYSLNPLAQSFPQVPPVPQQQSVYLQNELEELFSIAKYPQNYQQKAVASRSPLKRTISPQFGFEDRQNSYIEYLAN